MTLARAAGASSAWSRSSALPPASTLVAASLWPPDAALLAFEVALINVLGLFGWTMMPRVLTPASPPAARAAAAFAATLDVSIWYGKVPRTILAFWLPAHTVTFSLPGEWRILAAAALSVALGFLLSAASRPKA
jgi:hypothetical protein